MLDDIFWEIHEIDVNKAKEIVLKKNLTSTTKRLPNKKNYKIKKS